jgi:hypothetical protein
MSGSKQQKRMEPKAFIDLAQSLVDQNDPSEAAIRTSVSRSYYGLYNLLSSFFKDNGFQLPGAAEAHKIVYRELYSCGIPSVREIAEFLQELRQERNKADYRLELAEYAEDRPAKMSLIKARTAYDQFGNFTGGNKRKQLVKRIAKYRKTTNS